MKNLFYNPPKRNQYAISIVAVSLAAALGLGIEEFVGYRVVAFMLLVTVSILAMFFDIIPVIVAAVLSALLWDYLFMPPRFALTVGTDRKSVV